MEGWRQRRLGSMEKEEMNKKNRDEMQENS
jgi:hypothetical protein